MARTAAQNTSESLGAIGRQGGFYRGYKIKVDSQPTCWRDDDYFDCGYFGDAGFEAMRTGTSQR